MSPSKSALAGLALPVLMVLLTAAVPSATWGADGCDKAPHFASQARFSKDNEKTIQLLNQAIELCPGFIRPYELLGNLYRNQGQKDKAIALFTKAAELGTGNYKLYHLLAGLLFEKKEFDDAHRYIQKAISIRPDFQEALDLKKQIEAVSDREGPRILLYEPATARGLALVVPQENLTVRG
ncbi:MAG: tetratricopeptide repeat protein, partial [Deltaproteobacteria bacterium]|nr:tetratricopeptide repeat protein [Deltaproteobacteria bacterium]